MSDDDPLPASWGLPEAMIGPSEAATEPALPSGTPPASARRQTEWRHVPQRGERPHHAGHRQRLRDRFAAGGAESMPDYELVEMILFNAVPKVGVKPLAKRLLEDFGSFGRLLTASREELARHPQVDRWIAHHLKLAEAVAIRLAESRLPEAPMLGGTVAVIAYLRTRLAHSPIEHFRALFLDAQHRLIAEEELGRGTVNHMPVYPREVVKRALERNAVGVVLVHNHPSGDPRPSRQDVDVTRQIQAALATVAITLLDHLIIGKGSETSFAAEGLLS